MPIDLNPDRWHFNWGSSAGPLTGYESKQSKLKRIWPYPRQLYIEIHTQ